MTSLPRSPSPLQGRGPAGIALLRKPAGLTSFQALGAVKRVLGTRKVGHAGTLDRFASGLLVVLVGPYCRLAAYAEAGKKLYRGTIAFGSETRTLDPEGEVVAEGPLPGLDLLETSLAHFRGSIRQRPPLFSAVHLQGRRAYERALAGEEPEMPERQVEIYELELESYGGGFASVRVCCSAGTYIRSLARDIGHACGTFAHLAKLERLAIGPYRVEDAPSPEDFDPARDLSLLDPKAAASLGLVPCAVDDATARRFLYGMELGANLLRPLDRGCIESGDACAIFDGAGELLGIVEVDGAGLRYRAVLAAPAALETSAGPPE